MDGVTIAVVVGAGVSVIDIDRGPDTSARTGALRTTVVERTRVPVVAGLPHSKRRRTTAARRLAHVGPARVGSRGGGARLDVSRWPTGPGTITRVERARVLIGVARRARRRAIALGHDDPAGRIGVRGDFDVTAGGIGAIAREAVITGPATERQEGDQHEYNTFSHHDSSPEPR
jgi:hypothetical protein